MGFILYPKTCGSADIYVNAWHWRCTLEILRRADVLDAETLEWMGIQICHPVDTEQALDIADYLDQFLMEIGPGQRVLLDGSVVADDDSRPPLVVGPESPALNADDIRWAYSTTCDWLARFRDFCRISEGFEVG